MMADMLLGVERQLEQDVANARVRLEGGSDSMKLSFAELQHFMGGYHLPFAEYRFTISSSAHQVTVRVGPSEFYPIEMRRFI
jgi:hypothetical protein